MNPESNVYYAQGQTGLWEIVIGLEVHAQVSSKYKLFSCGKTDFQSLPNTNLDLLDLAFPGSLPVVNMFCVQQAARTGLALNATVHNVSLFDRKNYFYPDLPQGYQISQFYHPIVTDGFVEIDVPYPNNNARSYEKKIGVERLHLEQDAGKTIHDQDPNVSFLDFNRSGAALMEIVSKPDLRSPEEVKAYVRRLQLIMRTIGTCDGNMEEGSLRVDVNLSVRRVGESALGTRCEIKNLNSFKAMDVAIEYEAHRQIETLESGGAVLQETRLFDAKEGETRSMRLKEDAQDYRYIPDPDLREVHLSPALIRALKAAMPELPDVKKQRFMREYGLPAYDATILTNDRDTSAYFEQVVKNGANPKLSSSWIIGDLFSLLNKENKDIASSPVTAKSLSELLVLLQNEKISGPVAKAILKQAYAEGSSPLAIANEQNLFLISDDEAIGTIIDDIIRENPALVDQVKEKPKMMGWFVGQVMKKSEGKAKPQVVQNLLSKKLGL